MSLREENVSIWVATSPETSYPPLAGAVIADVAVIGGGIAGLTTALLLQQAGHQVTLVEADRIAAGTTAYTTGKVTSLHQLIYARLRANFDAAFARQYAQANEAGVAEVARLVQQHGIECDFERLPAITYTEEAARLEEIHAEVDAARQAGLAASFTATTDLPYPVQGAVRVEDQAQFHSRRYCLGLARAFEAAGGRIFEMSRVLEVKEGNPCTVHTAEGSVAARHVVVATLLPFLDRGGFFAKTWPSRSYGLAARLRDGATPLRGMYINIEQPTRSVRPYGERTIIVVGEGHKVGQDADTRQRYEVLERWTRERFPVEAIEYRWSAQDYMPVDGVPYIGRMPLSSEHLWVATGFQKWGLSAGTLAAMLLSDLIQGRANPWQATFDATRADVLQSAKDLIVENANVAKRFLGDRLMSLAASSVDRLPRGEGAIVEISGHRVAAYRDENDQVHAVSPVCTHMGCFVQWNSAEKSWDCPCHGSRFDRDGRILVGPALRNLERKE